MVVKIWGNSTGFKWIKSGNLDTIKIHKQLQSAIAREMANTLKEKAKIHNISELDESDSQEGFPAYLQEAYSGALDFDSYVILIIDSECANKYKMDIPDIDWDKVYEKIKIKADSMIDNEETLSEYRLIISQEDSGQFSERARKAYDLIRNYRESNQ